MIKEILTEPAVQIILAQIVVLIIGKVDKSNTIAGFIIKLGEKLTSVEK